ncbi:MAG TPA: ankyrin repeat domain-containing protein [Gammaproteobacteria bacterium]|nr:ankyrin repeat domain-containing protein [Gammaproteobacteria bacterium]
MTCSHSESCDLYVQFAMEPSLKLWKQHFCEGEFERCARFQVALSGRPVPLGLLPNGKELQAAARSQDEVNATALFNAVLKGRVGMVKSFVKSRSSTTHITSSDGTTPVMTAASVGHLEILQILLEGGCCPHPRNQAGQSALDIAEAAGHTECADLLREYLAKTPAPSAAPVAAAPAQTTGEKVPESAGGMSEVLGFLRKLNPLAR